MLLNGKLSPTGEYGKRYAQANDSSPSSQMKTRKMLLVKEEASRKAMEIITNSSGTILSMINILSGIMRYDVDIKYGTIFNLDVLGGSKHDTVKNEIKKSIGQFQQVLQILGKIEKNKELFKQG